MREDVPGEKGVDLRIGFRIRTCHDPRVLVRAGDGRVGRRAEIKIKRFSFSTMTVVV